MPALSPLAPASTHALPPVAGVRIATADCGIRYKNRDDVLLMQFAEGTTVAGVLTRSLTASAPVLACRHALKHGKARALVVNAGNANAFTGSVGQASVERVMKSAASVLGCPAQEVFTASTGVIGERLPDDKITAALSGLKGSLSESNWENAARAIMTTDTFPKMVHHSCDFGGVRVTLNGIAKGSGMIAPDMATLLSFLCTDAAIPSGVLQQLLTEANERSFNCISVDGDTSTSDTVLLFATGKAGNPNITSVADPRLSGFRAILKEAMVELAQLVAKDGEGAQKFITITVTGAEHEAGARKIGLSIANSPLVKTAIAASDANWGRIVAAVGKAGEKANRDQLAIHIGGVSVAKNGEMDPEYRESLIEAHMKGREIEIAVDVGIANGRAVVWTCDLTHGYIDINGSYRS